MRAALGIALCTTLALVSACRRSAERAVPDASATPARIVSVGGAVTETLFALGAGERVVGVDTSSVYPESATRLPQVGYQRALSAEGILALRPTLVLVSSEAGPPAVLAQLRTAGVTVEVVPVDATAPGAKAGITTIARRADRDPAALIEELGGDLERAAAFASRVTRRPRVLVLYARGASTLHVFGTGTAAAAMVQLGCGENAVTAFEGTRPLTSEAVVSAAPDVVLLPTRALDALGGIDEVLKVPGVAETPAGRARRIVTLDDLLLLGFGPRTGKAALELCGKLHPGPGETAL